MTFIITNMKDRQYISFKILTCLLKKQPFPRILARPPDAVAEISHCYSCYSCFGSFPLHLHLYCCMKSRSEYLQFFPAEETQELLNFCLSCGTLKGKGKCNIQIQTTREYVIKAHCLFWLQTSLPLSFLVEALCLCDKCQVTETVRKRCSSLLPQLDPNYESYSKPYFSGYHFYVYTSENVPVLRV